jgi:hypothetical protein
MATSTTEKATAAEVQRIDFTGTIWFGATLIATAIPLGGLLASGWRPSALGDGLVELWWVGAALMVVGMAGLVWAGCPVAGFPLPVADRQKAITIRAGIVLYGVGAVAAVLAVLLSPPA